jgi:hypothetical protein
MKGMDISENDKLQLILSTINKVLQPILVEVDALGMEFEKAMEKEHGALSFEDFVEKYSVELGRFRDALELEYEQNTTKREHVLRGEIELRARKREQSLVSQYEHEIEQLKQEYEAKLKELEDTFDDEVEKRTTEFINERLEFQQKKLLDEYQLKLKNMRDELELKYITSDLNEREEKLRKEFNEYEKSLRESFDVREKALREELDIHKNNFRESQEIKYKTKLEDAKERLQRDYDHELEDAITRIQRKEERRFEVEMKRREKALEKTLKKEFARKEKELQRLFKHELQNKESEVKAKLQLSFEREKLKLESQKSEAFLNLIDKEMDLKYKEMEKFKADMIQVQQMRDSYTVVQKQIEQTQPTRNFITPPTMTEGEKEGDLFSKILQENRILNRGLPKKKFKKVS